MNIDFIIFAVRSLYFYYYGLLMYLFSNTYYKKKKREEKCLLPYVGFLLFLKLKTIPLC